MPVAYSYLRFSSAAQSSGDSIRRQTAATAGWCARNKVDLDTALKMQDSGVSAFRGKNRENGDTNALARFLELVKAGKIARGSYLVVESLDRLSREKIRPALALLLQLIGDGIRVVQLSPVEAVFDDQVEPMQLMVAIMELNRGHSESAMKSERVGAAWAAKQKNAAAKAVTRRCPTWLRAVGGVGKLMKNTLPGEVKFELIEKRAAVVRRIFALAIAGRGMAEIVRMLNAEGVPTFGRAPLWTAIVVREILRSRATVGEHVPYASRAPGAPPKGEPIPGYFPAAVSEETYQKAAAHVRRRRQVGKGRRGENINLFAGLLRDAREGGRTITYWHSGGRPAALIPAAAKEGVGPEWVSFRADDFERGILSNLCEVTADDVLGTAPTSAPVADLEHKLGEVDALIATWTAKMDDLGIVSIVAAKLSELSGKRAALKKDLDKARGEVAAPLAEAWGEVRDLGELAEGADDQTRLKLRSVLRRTIERMDVLLIEINKAHKRAAAVITFAGTDAKRCYYLKHQRGQPVATYSAKHFFRTGPDLSTPEGLEKADQELRTWTAWELSGCS